MDNGASSYRRFLDGDDNGIAEIVRDYKDGLILYINGIVSDISLSEDLMEDTFFKLLVKKPRFSGKSSFKTWLYAIGRNVAMDYLRHNAKISNIAWDECQEFLGDEEALEKSYIREEQKITVHRVLRKLKPEYRQILYLIYFEDFNNAQAATIMKKSKHQIETLAYRARKSLRAELEKEGFVYEGL